MLPVCSRHRRLIRISRIRSIVGVKIRSPSRLLTTVKVCPSSFVSPRLSSGFLSLQKTEIHTVNEEPVIQQEHVAHNTKTMCFATVTPTCKKLDNTEYSEETLLNELSKVETIDISESSPKLKDSKNVDASNSNELKKTRSFFEERFTNESMMLGNYLQACLYSGQLTLALNLLDLRIKSVLDNFSLGDTHSISPSSVALQSQVYDLLLSRLASISPNTVINCNFIEDTKESRPIDVIKKIFTLMRKLDLKPSASSYAAALEALDKIPNLESDISQYLFELKSDGHTLEDVIKTRFPGSKSFKHVENSILRVLPRHEFVHRVSSDIFSDDSPEKLPLLVKDYYKSRETKPGALELPKFSNLQKSYSAQIDLEKSRLLKVKSILNVDNHSSEMDMKKKHLSNLLTEWRASLLKAFQDLKRKARLSQHQIKNENWEGHYLVGTGGKVYPFLCLLPEQDYVEIVINQLCSTIHGGDFTTLMSYKLGEEVHARFTMHVLNGSGMLQKLQTVYKEYSELYSSEDLQRNYSPRQLWLDLERKHGLTNMEEKVLPWHRYWKLLVGIKLIEIMNTVTFFPQKYWNDAEQLKTSSENEKVPAIFNSYVVRGKKQFGMTIPHPQFRLLLREALDELIFESEVAPMVIPPRPWCDTQRGGLLASQVEFLRQESYDDDNGLEPIPAEEGRSLAPIYDSLNILGSVAWVINKPLLDLQIKYFQNGGSKELNIPLSHSNEEEMPDFSSISQSEPEKYNLARKKAIEVQKIRREMHGLFMEALYKFSIANAYRDKVIWFVHNIDFRGRFYPVAKHLNYMGSDVYRSLFLFANGRELGKNGLDWLKLHCINLTEFKKHSSIKERLSFADEVLDKILESAENPDAKDAWWKASDKPWQTLATCIEIASALKSPDPEKYVSKLPVHQDGSCNGLQHYAALGRDILGAKQVNLSPSVVPQDVYVGVAEKAEQLRQKDAQSGNSTAKILDGFVRRKVVKQTVMTTVYGVTRYGGMHQIKRQLLNLEDEFEKSKCSEGANYLVDKVFSSITEMFSGARDIQNWLTQIADVVSKMGAPVDWTTPLNLLVTQPYYKQSKKYISSPVQRLQVLESMQNVPNTSKQRNGFPPNFVHSLDSTHMMLTSLHCYRHGVTFASVHDCFWTHASDIDKMSEVCREQFIAMHSQPILQNLANHLEKHLEIEYDTRNSKELHSKLENLLNNIPQQGEFDLQEVRDSTFFFS